MNNYFHSLIEHKDLIQRDYFNTDQWSRRKQAISFYLKKV